MMKMAKNTTKYKKVYMPNHPHAMSCGCVYEHRLVMEQQLGRYLLSHEQVHHIDGNKSNNDPRNLMLCPSQKAHSEQHSYDNDFLIELLIRYADIKGKLPSKRECDKYPQLPSSSTYIRHFGSWSRAKQLAKEKIQMVNDEYEFLEAY